MATRKSFFIWRVLTDGGFGEGSPHAVSVTARNGPKHRPLYGRRSAATANVLLS